MSKTKRRKLKKYYGYNKTQQLLVKLDRLTKRAKDPDDRKLAQEIGLVYIRKGWLPAATKIEAQKLIKKYPDESKPKRIEKRHYLYAISNGEHVKIGMAVDVKKRMANLQTGSPTQLKIEWYKHCAEDSKEAKRQETKLHRRLKAFHVRGEWHTKDCLEIVHGWRIRNIEAKQEEEARKINEALDAEYEEHMARI